MKIEKLTVGAFAMNCYVLADPETSESIIIDPGMEADRIIRTIEELHLQPQCIINTHCHIDHAAEAATVQKHFDIPFFIHKKELPLLEMLKNQGMMFGIPVSERPEVTGFLNNEATISFGRFTAKILHTPGHSPGGICLSFPEKVFVGDCLFNGSIGRTDLYGGNYEQLINSIKTKLLVLPDSTEVYSGHGPETTIGREKQMNPFLNSMQ